MLASPRWRLVALGPSSATLQPRRRLQSLRRGVLPGVAARAGRWLHAAAAAHGRRRTGAHQTVRKPNSSEDELVARLQAALPNAGVALGVAGACPGCGVALQSHAPSGWGYVPASGANMTSFDDLGDPKAQPSSLLVCQRCHKLRHHNDCDVQQMTALQARRQLEEALGHRRCIVVVVVDLLDFHGSFVPGLAKHVGKRRPVIIAANKVDLLPSSAHKVRLEQWVWRESRKLYGYPTSVKSVHLVSSAMQQGLPALLESIRFQALQYAGRDGVPAEVVVVGAANAGKSTLLNAISSTIEDAPAVAKRKTKASKYKRKGDSAQKQSRLTESLTPGTTLRCIPMTLTPNMDEREQVLAAGARFGQAGGLGSRGPPPLMLLDTPGQIVQTAVSATAQLSLSDARLLHPKRPLRPTPRELRPGKAVLLGGLAVVEHSAGVPIVARVFVAEGVTVHFTDASRAEDVRQQHCGTLLTPPSAEAESKSDPTRMMFSSGSGGGSSSSRSSDALRQALALEESLTELDLELLDQEQDDGRAGQGNTDGRRDDDDELSTVIPDYIDVDNPESFSVDWDAEELGSWSAVDDGGGGQGPVCKAPKLSSKVFSLDFSSHEHTQKNNGDHFDIVISGLGWVSVRAADTGNATADSSSSMSVATLTVSAPLGTLKLLRTPSLLPFEDGHRAGRRGKGANLPRKRAKHFSKKRVWTPAHQRVSKKKRGY